MNEFKKPVIGFTPGDINGIGMEMIIKTVANPLLMHYCIPVIYANSKLVNFYRKPLQDANFTTHVLKEGEALNPKVVNIVNVWDDAILANPRTETEESRACGEKAFQAAWRECKEGRLTALLNFPLLSTLDLIKNTGNATQVLVSDDVKVACIPAEVVQSVASNNLVALEKNIYNRLQSVRQSMRTDFGILAPKIAFLLPQSNDILDIKVLEIHLKQVAIQNGIYLFGIYRNNDYFEKEIYKNFDIAISLTAEEVLPYVQKIAYGGGMKMLLAKSVVRLEPLLDDFALQSAVGNVDPTPLQQMLFTAISILKNREEFQDLYRNPIKRISKSFFANADDEAIS